MTVEEWLEQGMKSKGIRTQQSLANLARVTPATLSNIKKKNSMRGSTQKKIESIIGPYDKDAPGPQETVLHPLSDPTEALPDTSKDTALQRYRGNSCPTKANTCRSCWETLLSIESVNGDRPVNRACCRLEHGWVLSGGWILFEEETGTLVREEDL